MKVYTKTGDRGTTSLVGGTRVDKDTARLEAYGTVDELNSWIGLLASQPHTTDTDRDTLIWIQHRLFDIGSILATEPQSRWQPQPITGEQIERIEHEIDRLEETLPHHNHFILPGGTQASAFAQIARTIARRAERRIITMARTEHVAPETSALINRLSDYLFVYARHLNHHQHQTEIFWEKGV